MNKTMKKLLSLILSVVLVLCVITPGTAKAATVNRNEVMVDFTLTTEDGVYYHNPQMLITDFDLTPYYTNNFAANPSDPTSVEKTPAEWFDTVSGGVTLVHALTQITRDTLLDGEAADVTEWLEFGASGWITKCLGSTDSCGYSINGEYVSTLVPQTVLKNGDQVHFYMYNWMTTNTAYFNTYQKSVNTGEEFTLNLIETGYDNNWNMVEFPVDGAEIVLIDRTSMIAPDTISTGFYTDVNGDVTMKFDEEGIYTLSVMKSGITMPICTVTVTTKTAFVPDTDKDNIEQDGLTHITSPEIITGNTINDEKDGTKEEIKEEITTDTYFSITDAKAALKKVKVNVAKNIKKGKKKLIKVTLPNDIAEYTQVIYKSLSKKLHVNKNGIVKGKKKGKGKVTISVEVRTNEKIIRKKFTKTISII